ncbi:MAG TPA: transglycosylase SLT domain-containing protein, partial [Reyranella sp.]|nr:transglycosylase SLT domain-containing protein [Reyranella sp.]
TDAWLERESGADGAALVERVGLDNALPEQQRYILWAKIAARESADESRRFATVKGLDDRLAKATVTIATQPALYKTGTLAAIANAYEAAGAADQAAETRRLALLEPLFRPFAQLGIAAQRRHLDTFAGPEHTMAEAIMRHQADAFARDPYAAGIALYPELGPSPPAQDADGRLAQIRMIEARRGTPASVAEPGAMTKVQADATEKGVLQNRPTWTDGASRSRDGGTDAAGIPSAPSADGAPDDVQLSQAKRPQAKRPPKNETGEAAIASPQQPAERQQASVEAFALEAERRAMKWVDLIYGQPNTSNQKLLPDDWQQTTNPQYVEWMRDAAEQHGVPLELLARHLYKESTFNPKAQNGDHKGLGQLGPSAIAAIGIKGTFDYFDAKSSIYASAAYLNLLHRQMKSWPAAIAAYNAGPTIVGAWLNNKSTRFSKAKPPYEPNEETQEAIRHVFRGDPRAFGE